MSVGLCTLSLSGAFISQTQEAARVSYVKLTLVVVVFILFGMWIVDSVTSPPPQLPESR